MTAQKIVKRKLLDFRALERLIQTELFERAVSLDGKNPDLEAALEDGNVEWIRDWMKTTLENDLAAMTLSQLRAKARQYAIPYAHDLSKELLIVEITNARRLEESARRMSPSEGGLRNQILTRNGCIVPAPTGKGRTEQRADAGNSQADHSASQSRPSQDERRD